MREANIFGRSTGFIAGQLNLSVAVGPGRSANQVEPLARKAASTTEAAAPGS
jgi:hypothetical protein